MSKVGFNQSYDQYLILRGYDPATSKLLILKRALIDSWAEPGFHEFWEVWNPGVGHLLYQLYRALGGNRFQLIATMLVFTFCGFVHDVLVILLFRRPFVAFTASFIFFGIFTVLSRTLEPILRQNRWSGFLNVFTNVLVLTVSIYAAVQLQMLIFP
jgi:hypothetical protein